MTEANKHQDILKNCIERGADYYLIYRDKNNKLMICYSHDWEGEFRKEVFKIFKKLLKKPTTAHKSLSLC